MKGAILFFVISFVIKTKAQICGIGAATSQYGNLFDDDGSDDEGAFKSYGDRIIGGVPVETGVFPWHCTTPAQKNWGFIQVSYGSAIKEKQISQISTTMFQTAGDNEPGEDIALIKLNTPIEFNENVSSICLSRSLRPKIGDKAVIAGFGNVFLRVTNTSIPPGGYLNDTDIATFFPNNLYAVPLSTVDSTLCKCHCTDPEGVLMDIQEDKEFCAGGLQQGTLPGDSGGPFMILETNSMQWFQVGVTARGESTATNDTTKIVDRAVYSDISKFCDWIEKTTEKEVVCSD